jgi:hypothetical protein
LDFELGGEFDGGSAGLPASKLTRHGLEVATFECGYPHLVHGSLGLLTERQAHRHDEGRTDGGPQDVAPIHCWSSGDQKDG